LADNTASLKNTTFDGIGCNWSLMQDRQAPFSMFLIFSSSNLIPTQQEIDQYFAKE